MQIILQATHGVVSGAPSFFRHAFGDTMEEFEQILLLPHDFIFNREWFEIRDPKERLAAFQVEFGVLDSEERAELTALLSSCDPKLFAGLPEKASTKRLKRVLPFYVPLPDEERRAIWAEQRALAHDDSTMEVGLAQDERVEDAGLEPENEPPAAWQIINSIRVVA